GAGHIHKERVGRVKSNAKDAHDERRARSRREPGWCPTVERQEAKSRAVAEIARQRARITLRAYADDYLAWARINKRSGAKEHSRVARIIVALGDRKLDEVATADVERFLGSLREGERPLTPASVNRYRDM